MQTIKQKCSPNRLEVDGTCFTKDEIVCISRAFSSIFALRSLSDAEIEQKSTSVLWNELIKALQHIIDLKGSSWLMNPTFMEKVQYLCPALAETICFYALRPAYTGNPQKQWLNELDLNGIMAQYVAYIPTLHYEGTFTADSFLEFLDTEAPNNLFFRSAAFNQSQIWSMIINTAWAEMGGEHWVAVCQTHNGPLEYFDPEGDDIAESLKPTIDWMASKSGIKRNTLRHQYDDYMCGPYSCFFICNRAKNVDFEMFNTQPIDFSIINDFRRLSFQ